MNRALMQFFEKQPNMRNKASMFIWKESWRVKKQAMDPSWQVQPAKNIADL